MFPGMVYILTTYKNADDWGTIYGIVLTAVIEIDEQW